MIEENRELLVVDGGGVLATLSKAEIDIQIATAHRFPRSIKLFTDEAIAMVTLTEAIAEECIYALPRDGKTIEGPSARFAEVIASAWGNSRSGARVVSEEGEFVTAQGVFHDLQKNVAITYEVKRRIVDKHGKRFKVDMIGVTANAACSIALRNAILKGVPKAFWAPVYDRARATIMGDFETLANRRAAALKEFQKFGVTPEKLISHLGVKGEADITIEMLVTLRGMLTALREGDSTPEQMFPEQQVQQPTAKDPAEAARAAAKKGDKKADKKETVKPPKDGAAASPELKAKFLQRIGTLKEREMLDLEMDGARMLKWENKEDLEEIETAYKKRIAEISGS